MAVSRQVVAVVSFYMVAALVVRTHIDQLFQNFH